MFFQCFVFPSAFLYHDLSFDMQKPSHVTNIHWKFLDFFPNSLGAIKVLHFTVRSEDGVRSFSYECLNQVPTVYQIAAICFCNKYFIFPSPFLYYDLSFDMQKPSHVTNIHWKFCDFFPTDLRAIKVLHFTVRSKDGVYLCNRLLMITNGKTNILT